MTWFFACFPSGKVRIFSQPTYYTTFLGESSKITKKLRKVQQNANLRDSVCWEVMDLSWLATVSCNSRNWTLQRMNSVPEHEREHPRPGHSSQELRL